MTGDREAAGRRGHQTVGTESSAAPPPWPPTRAATLRRVVTAALAEDLGPAGDVTTLATVPVWIDADAMVRTRRGGVAAGVDVLAAVWAAVDDEVEVQPETADGDALVADQVLARVSGAARSLVTGERTALNLLGHLCGIASLTARYVAAVDGRCAIRDTRKTTPGLRVLEKDAVVAGGGRNHRFGLSDALLVKDNHVAAAGGIEAATRAAQAAAAGREVQVEVDTLEQLDTVMALGVSAVLLDNFSLDELGSVVRRCRDADPQVYVEASGGVGLDTVAAIADTGVDAIAVGALTHSAPHLDIGLDIALHDEPGSAPAGRGG